jgi:hypothetical protein
VYANSCNYCIAQRSATSAKALRQAAAAATACENQVRALLGAVRVTHAARRHLHPGERAVEGAECRKDDNLHSNQTQLDSWERRLLPSRMRS